MRGFEASLVVDRPLAGDVVGNFDVAHLAMLEIFGNNIVSVDITKNILVPLRVQYKGSVPFSTLQVADRIRKDETMTCADRLNNAGHNIAFTSTRICLANRVEVATAACNLGPPLEGLRLLVGTTHLLFVCVLFNMLDISRVFNEVRQPRSELRVIYLTILELKPEVSIDSEELGVHPSEIKINCES